LVAVHCTHGYNRTGFLISWYLMTKRGFNPFEAVEEFRRCRPPGMYRQNYVDQLFQLWNGDAESKASLPPVPEVEIPPWTISNNNNARTNNVKDVQVQGETSSSRRTRFDGLRSNSHSQQQQHQSGRYRSRNRPSRWEPYAQPLPQAQINNYHHQAPSQFYTEDYTVDNFNFNSPYAGDPGQWTNRYYNNNSNPYHGPIPNNMAFENGGIPRRHGQPQYQHPPMRHRYDGHQSLHK